MCVLLARFFAFCRAANPMFGFFRSFFACKQEAGVAIVGDGVTGANTEDPSVRGARNGKCVGSFG